MSLLALGNRLLGRAALPFRAAALGDDRAQNQERGGRQGHERLESEEPFFDRASHEGAVAARGCPHGDDRNEKRRSRRAALVEADRRPDQQRRQQRGHAIGGTLEDRVAREREQ